MCNNLVHVAVTTYLRPIKKPVLLQAPPTILGTDVIVVVVPVSLCVSIGFLFGFITHTARVAPAQV